MNIALDVMGGDYAPEATLKGAEIVLSEFSDQDFLHLVGNKEVLDTFKPKQGLKNVKFAYSKSVIEMGDHPTKAFMSKENSSLALGFGLLSSGKVDAFCSAGNTGAMMVGAMFTIKTIPGIIRPGIAGFFPKEDGGFGVIIDAGANADCKPDVLDQFATMGAIYAKNVLKIPSPKVGLINMGEEESKGTLLIKETHKLLKINKKINFVGNIEGRDGFNDKADVMVCDGFTGNIMLKLAESIYDLMKKRLNLDDFFHRFNYEAVGGSPILGVNGNVITGHGVSTPTAIANMIRQGISMAKNNVHQKIKDQIDLI